jgi:glycine cleavage system H protein
MSGTVEASYRYAKSHEWVELLDGEIRMGISDHAQASLGDITYFELPEIGKQFNKGDVIGFVESVKAVSDIYAPVSFEVTAVNEKLTDAPEIVNTSPYTEGWTVKGKLTDATQVESLLDASNYETYIASEEG